MEHQELSQIGTRLKQRRMERGLSIRDLSESSGIAASTISQIETGKTSPNLLSLQAICDALQQPLYALFLTEPAHVHLVRSGSRQTFVRSQSGGAPMTESMLIEGRNEMSGGEVVMPAGTDSGPFAYHIGEEFVYVLSGSVRFELEGLDVYDLEPGDTLYYPNFVGHRWSNPSDRESRMLIVSTDPYRF